MKKIITILAFLYAISNFGQDILVEPGTGKKYFYDSKEVFVPAKLELIGKNNNPAIAGRIIETLAATGTGQYVQPIITKNNGYGKNGTFTKIYIDGVYFDQVQFLDATAKSLEYIIDPSSTVSTADAHKACATQMAVLIKTYNTAIERGYYKNVDVKVYIEGTEVTSKKTSDQQIINPNDFEVKTNNTLELREDPVATGNYGRIKTDEKKVVSPTTNQLPNSIYTYKTYEVEQKTVVDWCETNRTNYPDLFDLYQKTHSLKVFNKVPGWSNRMDLKNCASGKTYVGRNWGWIAPIAAGLIFTAVDYKSDKINVIFHPKDSNGNGIPHTEP